MSKHQPGDKARRYSCAPCGFSCDRKKQLIVHRRTHKGQKPFVCTLCNKRFTYERYFSVHKCTNVAEVHSCAVCNKQLAWRRSLILHQTQHTDGENIYYCSACNKSFATSWRLSAHEKVHNREPVHCCSQCEKRCTTLHALKVHFNVHTDKYKCRECGKRFSSSNELKVHGPRSLGRETV